MDCDVDLFISIAPTSLEPSYRIDSNPSHEIGRCISLNIVARVHMKSREETRELTRNAPRLIKMPVNRRLCKPCLPIHAGSPHARTPEILPEAWPRLVQPSAKEVRPEGPDPAKGVNPLHECDWRIGRWGFKRTWTKLLDPLI